MKAPRALRIVVLAVHGILLSASLLVFIRTGRNSRSYHTLVYLFLATGAISLTLAAIPNRFSLRTLPIATTLVAVGLGALVCVGRN